MSLTTTPTAYSLKSMHSMSIRKKKLRLEPTPLSTYEEHMARELWNQYVDVFVGSVPQLKQLLCAAQVPEHVLITQLCEERMAEREGRMDFGCFLQLLAECKTVHCKWLAKIRGKSLDDDLLDAFVAVGGEEDSTGSIDVNRMRNIIQEFNLAVDIDKIVAEMDQDGNADIDFGEFAELLREPPEATIKRVPSKHVLLSNMIQVDEDLEQDDEAIKRPSISRENARLKTVPTNANLKSLPPVAPAIAAARPSLSRQSHLPSIGNDDEFRLPPANERTRTPLKNQTRVPSRGAQYKKHPAGVAGLYQRSNPLPSYKRFLND